MIVVHLYLYCFKISYRDKKVSDLSKLILLVDDKFVPPQIQ